MSGNRDYFRKPIQGNGRDGYDYGNTRLQREPDMPWRAWLAVPLFVVVLRMVSL